MANLEFGQIKTVNGVKVLREGVNDFVIIVHSQKAKVKREEGAGGQKNCVESFIVDPK